jgi:ABC-2 type transport system permease protein
MPQINKMIISETVPFAWLPKPIFDGFCLGKKFLIFNLVGRNLKVKYHRSVVGLFWTLLAPTAMALVYFVVFKMVMKVQVPNYLIFILSGVIPWSFFAQTIVEGMESIVGNAGLVTKIPIPLQIFSYVAAVTNFITLILALPILFGVAAIYHIPFGSNFLLLPFYIMALFVLAYAFGLVLSVAFVFFRDLRHLMGIVMQLWFFATPVVYSEQMIPSQFHWIIHVNPVGDIFCGLRTVLVSGMWPTSTNMLLSLFWVIVAFGIIIFFVKKHIKGVVELI